VSILTAHDPARSMVLAQAQQSFACELAAELRR
jgi:hypothetical protein